MKTQYTKKETDLINKTWQALMYRAEITTNEHALESALKYERKQRSSIQCAKVLIMAEALEYYKINNSLARPDLMALARTSQGILLGGLIGMESMERTKDDRQWQPLSISDLITQIQACYDLHWKAVNNSFDKLSSVGA